VESRFCWLSCLIGMLIPMQRPFSVTLHFNVHVFFSVWFFPATSRVLCLFLFTDGTTNHFSYSSLVIRNYFIVGQSYLFLFNLMHKWSPIYFLTVPGCLTSEFDWRRPYTCCLAGYVFKQFLFRTVVTICLRLTESSLIWSISLNVYKGPFINDVHHFLAILRPPYPLVQLRPISVTPLNMTSFSVNPSPSFHYIKNMRFSCMLCRFCRNLS